MSTEDRRHGRGTQLGTLLLATVLGVGVGLLAAPQAGTDTRRALRKRIDAARDGLGEGLEELEERSRPARRAVRARTAELGRRSRKAYEEALAELEDDDEAEDEDGEDGGAGAVGTVLAVGAGLAAAAYLLTSERAAPVRERVSERVREAAATVRDEAEARWDRFQRRRGNGHPATDPADSAPQTS